jgi:hypothetical protein
MGYQSSKSAQNASLSRDVAAIFLRVAKQFTNIDLARFFLFFKRSSDLLDLDIFLFALLISVIHCGTIKETNKSDFETVCCTEVFLTFSRLAAKLSEMIAKFQWRSLKIQHPSSFDLNSLKNGPSLHFKNTRNMVL